MCVAVPSKVISITDKIAVIDMNGVKLKASTMLLDDVVVGDYVIVHAGFAIQKMDEALAIETIELIRKALHSSDK